MSDRFRRFGWITVTVSLALAMWHGRAAGKTAGSEILAATGVTGGLVVHVGCGDGRLTTALHDNEGLLVHGLDTKAENVRAARRHIMSRGVYGKVSADRFDGRNLPYIDGCVNLVVCEDLGAVAMTEVVRVLAPGAVAYVKTAGRWRKTVKPRPGALDDWTHYLHGPDNNAVSQDTVVGPLGRIQWVAGPQWARSHEITPSIYGVVSSAGRVFYVHDAGPIGLIDERFPDTWSLIARDAFNGVMLWKHPIGRWIKPNEYWLRCTVTPNRRIVAEADRVYVALGAGKPVTVFDAARGRVLAVYKGTESARELVYHKGVLLVATGPARPGGGGRRGKTPVAQGAVTAIQTATGRRLWRATGQIGTLTLAARADTALFRDGRNAVCVDLNTGAERWRTASDTGSLVAHDKVVLVLHANGITAHSPADGHVLWRHAQKLRGFAAPAEVFVIDDLVWPSGTGIGLDLLTGKVKRKISVGFSPGHHHRCHQRKATVNYLLNSKRGVEFFDIHNKAQPLLHDWVRGTCRLGVVPANGLLYLPPNACFCYPGVQLKGFNALAPAGPTTRETALLRQGSGGSATSGDRLEKGPAFGASNRQSSIVNRQSDDWPTYRHDVARSGRASCKVPAALKRRWSVKLANAGKLTPPVIAGGVVYVAGVDTHQVHAVKADNGSSLWRFTAGGRIDSPPTIAQPRDAQAGALCLFGCRDGYVYCLRASDGELVWRFRAAPADRRLGACGQIESVWPVHGSVLVRGTGVSPVKGQHGQDARATIYVAAGRSSFVDGGISLYALDLATGRLRHQKQLHDRPMTVKHGGGSGPMDMLRGALRDLMVCNGTDIYMSRVRFDDKLNVRPGETVNRQGRRKTGLHLSATSGFLDDAYSNRSFWMYARVWPGYTLATAAPKSGQILTFDDSTTYSVKVFDRRGPRHYFRSGYFKPGSGYLLCADDNANEPQQSAKVKGAEGERPDQVRQAPPKWTRRIPVRVRAMVLADPSTGSGQGRTLFAAGPPDVIPPDDPLAALAGRKGAALWVLSAQDGKTLAEYPLAHPPVFDGMAAADGALFIVLTSGQVMCFR